MISGWGTLAELGFKLQAARAKVDKEAIINASRGEVIDDLRGVGRGQIFNCLDFDDQSSIDDIQQKKNYEIEQEGSSANHRGLKSTGLK